MKKTFLCFLMIATCGSMFAACPPDDNEVDAEFIITECGEVVQIPSGNYTGEQLDQLITIYTSVLC